MRGSRALTETLWQREANLHRVTVQLDVARTTPAAIDTECRRLEYHARARVAELTELLDDQGPCMARKAAVSLFEGPVTFTAESIDGLRRYRFAGDVPASALLASGEAPEKLSAGSPWCSKEASPRGFEPRLPT